MCSEHEWRYCAERQVEQPHFLPFPLSNTVLLLLFLDNVAGLFLPAASCQWGQLSSFA